MKFLFLFGIIFFSVQVWAADVRVSDGDSLVMQGRRIRLQGIDAPEYHQTCGDKNGLDYPCGLKALEFMQMLVKGKKVVCKKLATDIYKRDLSECFANGENINLKMLENGWAVLYRTDNPRYIAAQNQAEKSKIGLWQGKFMKPELYRILMKP